MPKTPGFGRAGGLFPVLPERASLLTVAAWNRTGGNRSEGFGDWDEVGACVRRSLESDHKRETP